MGWNQDIKAGEEISFGFTASYEDEKDIPHNFYISQECRKVEVPYSIDYNIVSEWDTGLNGEITISNNSDEVIEDWKLLLDCTSDFNAFWTADIEHKEDNTYYIGNRGYNSNIQPNQTIVLGFYAKKDTPDFKFKMENLNLYCMDVYQEDTTDTDKDGLSNGEEISLSCNPMVGDSDGDRLNDSDEVKISNTNPNEEDTDNDSVSDFIEIELGFNPLLNDTNNDGILDSDEKIQQDYHIDMNDGMASSLYLSMASNFYLEDELDVEYYTEADELTSLNLDGTLYKLDGDVTKENAPAKITFMLNENMYSDNMKVYCNNEGKFVPVDFVYTDDKNSVTVNMEKLSEKYCLGYEKVAKFSRKTAFKAARKVKYSKQDLVNDIKKF
jgi:hypothetical protein